VVRSDDRGGGVQRQLWKMTLDHLHGRRQGRALDVGTSNGSLAVVLAMENASLEVIGVDLWGAGWAYSLADCVRNAARAGVAERVGFVRASADDLPFDDGEFDNVVSHFVFHEVSSQTDKRELIREALRVLKPGGFFSFHDMFLDARLYGVPEELPALLRSWGVRSAELVDPGASLRVPRLLLGKRVLGNCAILHGRK
jgi:ubiquinone/menaquinone biosynthesis C-methylase UbiE